jgi:hypothetical protein
LLSYQSYAETADLSTPNPAFSEVRFFWVESNGGENIAGFRMAGDGLVFFVSA